MAAEFERSGLKPAGDSGYIQPVKLRSRRIVEEHSSLQRMIADSHVYEILLDELTHAGHIRVVVLLVEHWSAVACEATCAAILCLLSSSRGDATRSIGVLSPRSP